MFTSAIRIQQIDLVLELLNKLAANDGALIGREIWSSGIQNEDHCIAEFDISWQSVL